MASRDSFELAADDIGDDVRVLVVSGEADRFRTDEVRAAIEAARADGRDVVMDLSAVSYLDSSMIAVLVAASEQGRRRAERLVVLCETPRLRRSLELKGLETILQVAGSRDAAVELARGGASPPVPGQA